MLITLNGQAVQTAAITLADLVAEHAPDQVVATARNGRFVPVAVRAQTMLADADTIEMLAPMQGG
ncbi:MAG TPA: sulfur carrier protein ThiS [Rhodanobacteraceae bacterium]